jgi:uncharacterized membrane protein YbhN (UPF0104 family)
MLLHMQKPAIILHQLKPKSMKTKHLLMIFLIIAFSMSVILLLVENSVAQMNDLDTLILFIKNTSRVFLIIAFSYFTWTIAKSQRKEY